MPGVGPRSAERIALWMVQARGNQPEQIARAISETRRGIHPCELCGYFTTNELCDICSDSSRAAELLCVVEQPTDILPLEKTGVFRGRYHSLGGRISPLDHIGPEDLRIKELLERVEKEKFSEIIFALAVDVEGEATTNYLVDLLKDKLLTLTRIARGVGIGRRINTAASIVGTDKVVVAGPSSPRRVFDRSGIVPGGRPSPLPLRAAVSTTSAT